MSHTGLDPADASGFSFDALQGEVAAFGSVHRWRLQGRARDGRSLLLELVGVPAHPPLPSRLGAARLLREPRVTEGGWSIESEAGRFEAGAARLIVHEDVAALAAAAIPPRPVPLGKRLFWRAVFALLATSVGRRWLERRAASAAGAHVHVHARGDADAGTG